MKTKALVLAGIGAAAFAGAANAALTGASIINLGEINAGETTYQVVLNYDNPADKQLAVSGNADFNALIFSATSPLIQHELLPGALFGDILNATPGINMPGDSWVTIGANATIANTSFSPGFLGGNGSQSVINGSYFEQLDNGGYFDSNPGSAVTGNVILIAQFTLATGSDFSYQGTSDYNAGGTTLTSAAFAVSTVPAPGALALLGLAGLAGRRRRA